MARKSRIHYTGAIYHIIARGNNREPVFRTVEDKTRYLYYLEKYKQKYNFTLYAYVLMDNHVHLLGSVQQAPLGKIMQGVQQSYTQYYNRKYERVGHVFEQRYKAKLCKNDHYLLCILRYIHQNPVRAGIGLGYEWSSHHAYQKGVGGLVNPDFLLSFFADNIQTAIKKYLAYMEVWIPEDGNPDLEGVYLADVQSITEDPPISENFTVKEILEKVSQETGITTERIVREKYDRRVVEARDMAIYSIIELDVLKKSEISKVLPLSLAGVIKSYDRVLGNEKLRQKAEGFKNSLIRKA